jgi:hypothetical protein
MRMMLKTQLNVEAANLAIADGSIANVLDHVMGLCRPEASYFLTEGGLRTVYVIFDMTAPEQVPQIAEPLFHAFGATVEFRPVMVAAELQRGIAAWAAAR